MTKTFFHEWILKKLMMKKNSLLSAVSIENLKTLKCHTLVLSIICEKYGSKDETISKE